MVVNNTALPPSPYGYINSPKCTLTEATCNVKNQLLCAQNLTLRHMAMTEQNGLNCTIEAITYNEISTSMTMTTKSTIIKPNDSSARCVLLTGWLSMCSRSYYCSSSHYRHFITSILLFNCVHYQVQEKAIR